MQQHDIPKNNYCLNNTIFFVVMLCCFVLLVKRVSPQILSYKVLLMWHRCHYSKYIPRMSNYYWHQIQTLNLALSMSSNVLSVHKVLKINLVWFLARFSTFREGQKTNVNLSSFQKKNIYLI